MSDVQFKELLEALNRLSYQITIVTCCLGAILGAVISSWRVR